MRGRALYRAAAAGCRSVSRDSELQAGAAFVPAGFSSGTGVCARGERREVIRNAEFGMRNWGAGDERARHCGSVAAVCRRFAHGIAVLLRWFALGLRMALRFCCGVLPRFTPVFFPLSGKKRRLAMSCVSIPPGRDRHSCVLAMSVWLSAFGRFTSGLCVSLWRSRRVTGTRGTWIRDTGTAARPLCAFVQAH